METVPILSFNNVSYAYKAQLAREDDPRALLLCGSAQDDSGGGLGATWASCSTDLKGQDDSEGGLRAKVAAASCSEKPGEQRGSPLPSLALEGVSLEVRQGEFVAVIGHNGSGKSTLAKHINALFKPTGGTVLTVGLDTSDPYNTFTIRSHAGMVFQNPDAQMVTSVVADDVAFGPENLAVPHSQIVTRVDDALDAVQMRDFARRNPARLSGGQKQRICIAGVLAMKPDILVLDEPGAMLDPRGRRGIRRIVRELNAAGMTVVLITHFMEEAVLAGRVFVMAQGAVVMEGTPLEVFAQKERLRELKMEVPFSILLSEALRERGIPVSDIVRPASLREELHRLRVEHENDLHEMPPALSGQQAGEVRGDKSAGLSAGNRPPASLALEHLGYAYVSSEGKVEALRDVSLALEEGAFLGVIGHTGSGKSTLLQLMCGLLLPAEGRVLVDGEDLASKAVRRAVHTKVGMAFQYPEYQLFAPTVAEDIAFGPRNVRPRLDTATVNARVREAMDRMGLACERYAHVSPFELSGGEKRRVALAGVIACNPRILILDEPTAGLDPAGRREIMGYIEQFNREGMTIIMVSHSMDDIARLATQVLVLNQGETFMLGTPREVFAHGAKLRAINLGVPQATAFAAKLNEGFGFALPGDLYTVDALADAVAIELSRHPARNDMGDGMGHGSAQDDARGGVLRGFAQDDAPGLGGDIRGR